MKRIVTFDFFCAIQILLLTYLSGDDIINWSGKTLADCTTGTRDGKSWRCVVPWSPTFSNEDAQTKTTTRRFFIYVKCYGPIYADVCDAPSSTLLQYTVIWLLYVFELRAALHEFFHWGVGMLLEVRGGETVARRDANGTDNSYMSVSYTHLTLPTNREV